jgi:hypothetical protein
VPQTPDTSMINLLKISTRAERARHIITGVTHATPTLADLWRQVNDALDDIPVLTSEVARLSAWLTACRIDRANLAAAGRLTIAAYNNGESDSLGYLRDELLGQGFGTGRGTHD